MATEVKKKLLKLTEPKNFIAIIMAITFCVLCFMGVIGEQAFVAAFGMVTGYFFRTKDDDEPTNKEG